MAHKDLLFRHTLGLIADNAPCGFTYTSPAPALFTTPFVDAATGPTNVPTARFRMLLISALRLLRSCSSFTRRVSMVLVCVWALNTSCWAARPTE